MSTDAREDAASCLTEDDLNEAVSSDLSQLNQQVGEIRALIYQLQNNLDEVARIALKHQILARLGSLETGMDAGLKNMYLQGLSLGRLEGMRQAGKLKAEVQEVADANSSAIRQGLDNALTHE